MQVNEVLSALSKKEYNLTNEKVVQDEMYEALESLGFKKEHRFSKKDIIDFFHEESGIGIEVKMKGTSASNILRQCERYCEHDELKTIILATTWSMGFPEKIKGKDAYYFSITMNNL